MIDLENNKSFCPYAFKGALLSASTVGMTVPCCRFDVREHPTNEQDYFEEHESDIRNYNKNFYDSIRQKMINGEMIPGCHKCYKEEQMLGTSMRTESIKEFQNYDEQEAKKKLNYGPIGKLETIQQPELTYLEIQSGRYCNLKCRSCGPGLSTSWDEDLVSSDVLTNFFGPNKHFLANKLAEAPSTNIDLDLLTYDDCLKLTGIKITGGEPFLTDTVTSFLTKLNDWGLAKNISIEVFTNCSFFPKAKYREILPNFRLVTVCLSLDAVEQRAEFIRKKSKWQVVEKVAKFWNDFSLEHSTIKINISHTVSIFNVMYFYEFLKWAEQKFQDQIDSSNFDYLIEYHFVSSPTYLFIGNFSDSAKKNIVSHIDDLSIKSENELVNKYSKKLYKKYVEDVKKIMAKQNKNTTDEFKEKTAMFDKIRKENWQQVFPELVEVVNA